MTGEKIKVIKLPERTVTIEKKAIPKPFSECTWEKVGGRYVCMAKECPHWREGGLCELGKVSLSCDNEECDWNKDHRCGCMDVHLDADGKCLGRR